MNNNIGKDIQNYMDKLLKQGTTIKNAEKLVKDILTSMKRDITQQELDFIIERSNYIIYYQQLLWFAKINKIKGIRLGLKEETVLRKISEAGLTLPPQLQK